MTAPRTGLLSPLPGKLIELMPGACMVSSTHTYYTADGVPMESSVTTRISHDVVPGNFYGPRMSAAVFSLCERMRLAPTAPWNADQREQLRRWGQYKSAAEIAAAWDANRDNGTYVHQTIEYLLRGVCRLEEKRVEAHEIDQFLAFYKWFSRRYEIIAVEAIILAPDISTGGSIDAIAHERASTNPDEIVLVDWKNMPPCDWEKNAPLCNYFSMPRCKRAKQEVQLNMYASMIEAQTPKRVVRMLIVFFDLEAGCWDLIEVTRRREETEAYLAQLRRATAHVRPTEPLLVPAEEVKPLRRR